MQDEWRKYLTVLNLRNYGHHCANMMTEMIYVHSKLLIVDDAVAIIGSANINDRSLNGNGDTELAAVVVDDAQAQMTDVGQGIRIITRKFARDLRIKQWKKHLGMLVDEVTTGVQKEAGPPNGIDIEHPLAAATIKGIQALARQNRDTYSQVFLHTPRDNFKTLTEGREKAYPPLAGKKGQHDFAGMPTLQEGYMKLESFEFKPAGMPLTGAGATAMKELNTIKFKAHDVAKATAALRAKVKGFWVEMPLDWGASTTTSPEYPGGASKMIASNEKQEPTLG